MKRKSYIEPKVCTREMNPTLMIAVSVREGTADPNAEILVKDNDWDIFDEEPFLDDDIFER